MDAIEAQKREGTDTSRCPKKITTSRWKIKNRRQGGRQDRRRRSRI
jgi:hypothetical protein